MKSGELRLNNLVYGASDRIEKVTCIWPTIVTTTSIGLDVETSNELDDLKGIPLTEEWLIKFGFTRNDQLSAAEASYEFPVRMGLFFLRHYKTAIYKIPYYALAFPGTHGSCYGVGFLGCGCVHQLQNLYFALTGEELILKSQ